MVEYISLALGVVAIGQLLELRLRGGGVPKMTTTHNEAVLKCLDGIQKHRDELQDDLRQLQTAMTTGSESVKVEVTAATEKRLKALQHMVGALAIPEKVTAVPADPVNHDKKLVLVDTQTLLLMDGSGNVLYEVAYHHEGIPETYKYAGATFHRHDDHPRADGRWEYTNHA